MKNIINAITQLLSCKMVINSLIEHNIQIIQYIYKDPSSQPINTYSYPNNKKSNMADGVCFTLTKAAYLWSNEISFPSRELAINLCYGLSKRILVMEPFNWLKYNYTDPNFSFSRSFMFRLKIYIFPVMSPHAKTGC